jgi:hypothetical protein
VTVSDSSGATGRAAGSEAVTWPAGIVTEHARPKVSERTVPGSTAAPVPVLAMVAPVTRSGPEP